MQELKNESVSDAELESIAGGTTNALKQFAQGFTSGHFGPAYAYSDIKKPFGDTEPTSKRQRIARYAGIACGTVVGLGGYGAGWIHGTFLAQFHTNHKLKEELRKKK